MAKKRQPLKPRAKQSVSGWRLHCAQWHFFRYDPVENEGTTACGAYGFTIVGTKRQPRKLQAQPGEPVCEACQAAQEPQAAISPETADRLNHRQLRFAEEYLVDMNATKAAIRAGYSSRSAAEQGWDLLRNPKIQAAIAEARAKLSADLQVEKVDIVRELLKMGMSNALDYIRILPNGEPCVDFASLTRDQAAAITEVTVEDFTDGRGEDAREVRRVKYRVADKRAALMDVAKLLGHVKDKVEHSGEIATVTRAAVEAFADSLEDDELAEALAAQQTLRTLDERVRARRKGETG